MNEDVEVMQQLINDSKKNMAAKIILTLNTALNIKIVKLLPPPPCQIEGKKMISLMMLALYAQANEFEQILKDDEQ